MSDDFGGADCFLVQRVPLTTAGNEQRCVVALTQTRSPTCTESSSWRTAVNRSPAAPTPTPSQLASDSDKLLYDDSYDESFSTASVASLLSWRHRTHDSVSLVGSRERLAAVWVFDLSQYTLLTDTDDVDDLLLLDATKHAVIKCHKYVLLSYLGSRPIWTDFHEYLHGCRIN